MTLEADKSDAFDLLAMDLSAVLAKHSLAMNATGIRINERTAIISAAIADMFATVVIGDMALHGRRSLPDVETALRAVLGAPWKRTVEDVLARFSELGPDLEGL